MVHIFDILKKRNLPCTKWGSEIGLINELNDLSKNVKEELDEVWRKYHDLVNMTFTELKNWAENPCSYEASLDRSPIERNLRLLERNKDEWTDHDIKDAKRTIAFILRMSASQQGKLVSEECPLSRRDISLLNWAFDPRKST